MTPLHVHNDVAVRGHKRVTTHIDGEDLRQLRQPVLDPAATVLEGSDILLDPFRTA